MKYRAATYDALGTSHIVRLLQPWLRRYTGECRRTIECIRTRPELGRILYGVSSEDKGGRYRFVERNECERLCGPKAMEREGRDEDDWVNG